jgi:hypothetical protein
LPNPQNLKSAVSKLTNAGIPLDIIDPKFTTGNLNAEQVTYSEESFWAKLKKFYFTAGKEVVEKALMLYYTAQNPGVPTWAKTVVVGALTYFISPVDAIRYISRYRIYRRFGSISGCDRNCFNLC